MLLVVDIGNTQTVLGLYADAQGDDGARGQTEELALSSRIATRQSDTADELLVKLQGIFHMHRFDPGAICDVAIASVVPPLTEQWAKAAGSLAANPPLVVSHQTDTGLALHYSVPAEIGADRIADAVAAIHLYGAPVLVADFGTATNIEVIDKDGAFLGGIIAPGLATSAEALFSAAARLPKIDIEVPDKVIGTTTKTAVQSGLTFGEIDRIDGLVTRVFAELGYGAPVVATGGLSHRVVALSKTITHINDDLTLEGLRLIHQRRALKRSVG
jgi:type III pantothenate kinase